MLVHRCWSLFDAAYGRCEKCMRMAVRSAAAASVAAAALIWFAPGRLVVIAALVLAGGLVVNALFHLAAYSARLVRAAHGRARSVPPMIGGRRAALPALAVPAAARRAAPTRREALWMFFGTAASAAIALLAFPRSAGAACGDCAAEHGSGWYDCITYSCNTVGQACCPPGYPYLNHCDCQCYDGTNFDCGSYSACQYCG